MFKDNFNLAFKNIRARLSRSLLTLLGIAIGIMAIISLMGIGEGMNVAVTGELNSLSDTILVNVGEGFSIFSRGSIDSTDEYLTERDISDIERIIGIKEVTTQLVGGGILRFNGEDKAVTLTGIDSDIMQIQYSYENLEEGTLLQANDQNKIVIGYKVAYDYFDREISVDGKVLINGKKFFVSGIFGKQGMGGITSTDDIILLSPRDFEKVTGESNIYSATVTVYDVANVENIALEIERVINENHGDDDFASATTMSSILASIQMVLGIIQTVLVAIASIALVVASIGIMNTMLTSVMERTREIGIMKAIGATNKDIMVTFIMEGMLLSITGGLIGILLGVFGSKGVTAVLGNIGPSGSANLEPVISLFAVVLAVGVSMVVGVFSSLYPAWKAAKMSPIEAVRYE
ncbi:MAG: ABC transporter permease [Candidatus Thermoplasmatota archaeon]|nr:ABC transporter permease [Candidatus Thermoplasmatota archaeon]